MQTDAHAASRPALKAMAGAVVHELNNILTAAIGNLSLLDDPEFSDGDAATEIVAEALAAARRGLSLSEELEAFASQLRLEPDMVAVNSLVQQALADLPRRSRGVEVRMRLSSVPLRVYVDPVRFRRAVAGAALGAIGAMSKRADRLTVETSAMSGADGDRFVRVAIVCDGASVDEARLNDALVNFRCRTRDGTWGLASVAGFLTQSGGVLRAHVESASRLRLTIELPA